MWGGLRVPKDAARVQAYGTVDECNAAIGVARAAPGAAEAQLEAILARIQNQLFVVGADLATPGEAASIPRIGLDEIAFLEQTIDALETELARGRPPRGAGASTSEAAHAAPRRRRQS